MPSPVKSPVMVTKIDRVTGFYPGGCRTLEPAGGLANDGKQT
jgi:hypothetical protein